MEFYSLGIYEGEKNVKSFLKNYMPYKVKIKDKTGQITNIPYLYELPNPSFQDKPRTVMNIVNKIFKHSKHRSFVFEDGEMGTTISIKDKILDLKKGESFEFTGKTKPITIEVKRY